jgi:hypothetical protein
MKRFAHNDIEIWVGVHPKMGLLIYDPHAQLAVPSDKVRLYVWQQQRMATFLKSIVRDRLRKGDEETRDDSPLSESAEFYFALRGRFTHCYRCKNDLNSIDFDLCGVCHWIRCTCGACGCGYQQLG